MRRFSIKKFCYHKSKLLADCWFLFTHAEKTNAPWTPLASNGDAKIVLGGFAALRGLCVVCFRTDARAAGHSANTTPTDSTV